MPFNTQGNSYQIFYNQQIPRSSGPLVEVEMDFTLESIKRPLCSKEFDRIAVLGLDTKIRAQAEMTEELEAPS